MIKFLKTGLLAIAATALLSACNTEDSDDMTALLLGLSQQTDNATYVLMNIPYAKFYEADAESEFDSVSSATMKASNGALTYGNYHTSNDSSTNKEQPLGITFPVRVTDTKVLENLTEITDDSPSFEVTITGRGASTIRYSGKQNLYRSADYSYYKLTSKPVIYKQLNGNSSSNFTFGKLTGSVTDKGCLYITPNSQGHHLTWEISLALDKDGTAVSSLFNSEKANKVTTDSNGTEVLTETNLNALSALYAKTKDGKVYGLPVLSNYWRGTQFGANYDGSTTPTLDGKEIVEFTFITVDGAYSFNKARIYNYESQVFPSEETSLSYKMGNTLSSAPATIAALKETIVKANAYIDADTTSTYTSDLSTLITSAKSYLSSASSTDIASAKSMISSITSEISTVSSSLSITEEAFTVVTGTSGSRSYKGLFNPTILKSDYDSIWTNAVKTKLGTSDETTIANTVSALKTSISMPLYGEEALAAGQQGFNCELHPEDTVLTFSTADNKYTLSDGKNTYTYTYLGKLHVGEDDNFSNWGGFTYYDTQVYKASGTNLGEYTYLVLLDDSPETTYHIELRYGSDLAALKSLLSGKYALWLAAGIPSDADTTMITNVITLFVNENVN